jgi:hypothetical protein
MTEEAPKRRRASRPVVETVKAGKLRVTSKGHMLISDGAGGLYPSGAFIEASEEQAASLIAAELVEAV